MPTQTNKTILDNIIYDKIWQDKTIQGKPIQCNIKQSKAT